LNLQEFCWHFDLSNRFKRLSPLRHERDYPYSMAARTQAQPGAPTPLIVARGWLQNTFVASPAAAAPA